MKVKLPYHKWIHELALAPEGEWVVIKHMSGREKVQRDGFRFVTINGTTISTGVAFMRIKP